MAFTDDLQSMLNITVIIVICGLVLYSFFALFMADYPEDFLDYMKRVKGFIIYMLVAMVMVAVIPGSQTITKMMIAQNVTYERVEVVGDTVETVYNDIMALFEDNNSEGETE
jgi:hypothetical protein